MSQIPFFTVARDETQFWDPEFLASHQITKAYGIYLILNGEATHCCSLTPSSWAEFCENVFVSPNDEIHDELEEVYLGDSGYQPFTPHDPLSPYHSALFHVEQDRRVHDWRELAFDEARHEPPFPRISQ